MADDPKKEEVTEEEKKAAEAADPDSKKSIREVVEEVAEEEPDKETTPPKKEEAEEEIEKEEPEKDLDEFRDEIKKEAKEEAKKETKDEILKALGVTETEKVEAEKQGWQSPWEKRGETKPKDWREAVEAGADLADFRRTQTEAEQKKKDEAAEKSQTERREQLNKYWDGQLNDLRSQGKLPEIDEKVQEKIKNNKQLNEEDRKDPGLVAQYRLIETMSEVSKQRQANGQPAIYNLKEIFYEHYNADKQKAGADAPVSGGKTSVQIGKTDEDEMSYEELHRTDFEGIIRKGQ